MIELRIDLKKKNLSSSLASSNEIRVQMLEHGSNLSASLVSNNEIRVQMLERGSDGKTPIKGIDYMTPEDIDEIAREVQFDAGVEAATIEDIKRLF